MLRLALIICAVASISNAAQYYGKRIGALSELAHNVKGKVYAPSEDTIFIEGFSYDGAAPDAYFWAGRTQKPDTSGIIVPDELGRTLKLGQYNNQNVLLKLPNGMRLRDIKWFSIWCRNFSALFGSVEIPFDLDPPRELNLGRLPTYAHDVSASSVTIKDIKTLEIKDLRYDGAGPDAFFLVGKGNAPHQHGIKLADEEGRTTKLNAYNGKDITLRLPDNLTVFDIDWFGLYCIRFTQNFGHVRVPTRNQLNVPADLKTLASTVLSFSNCEPVFKDQMQVSWEVRSPDIWIQLEGRVQPDHYMAFGTSGSDTRAKMEGADVTVAYYQSRYQTAKVDDYILAHKSQCSGPDRTGACPDRYFGGRDDSTLVSWSYVDGILKVVYRRPLITGDDADSPLYTEQDIVLVGGIGPLNSKGEAAKHSLVTRGAGLRLRFNRPPNRSNCRTFQHQAALAPASAESNSGWQQAVLDGPEEFTVVIGPAGGPRGYTAITGIPSWGIAYWINGELIPEIHVVRGRNYTFRISSGNDPNNPARYHPFYITNNREGGGLNNDIAIGTRGHKAYAGIHFFRNGTADPSPGAGHYCEYKHGRDGDQADNVQSLEEYKRTLRLDCEPGREAVYTWTPDDSVPDTVYYQCFTHRNLGWKIRVRSGSIVNRSSSLSLIGSIITLLLFITAN